MTSDDTRPERPIDIHPRFSQALRDARQALEDDATWPEGDLSTGGVVEPYPIAPFQTGDELRPIVLPPLRAGKSATVLHQALERVSQLAAENQALRDQVRGLRIGWAATCLLLGFLLWWTMGGA